MTQRDESGDDKEQRVFKIKDIHKFNKYLKEKIWENFEEKFDQSSMGDSLIDMGEIHVELPEEIFNAEVHKFIITDDYDNSQGFIIKKDIFKLITSLTNEIVSLHLNSLVDEGILEMCWDTIRDEFIWTPPAGG